MNLATVASRAAALALLLGACLLAPARDTPPGPAAGVAHASFDLNRALRDAAPGDTIHLPPGVYPGPIVLDRPVTLVGSPGSILDAHGAGDVVRVTAPDVTLRGITIRATGDSVDRENSGVAVTAPRFTIENCLLTDVLFGISLSTSPGSTIRNNHVVGKDLDLGRRGDGIRAWECDGVDIHDNLVEHARDVVVWYCSSARIRRNTVLDGRYGLHTMYADDCVLEDNRLERNSVGIFMMYSRDLQARRNTIARNRGPSGFGIGLKDVDGVTIEDNLILGNRVAINLDTSPTRHDIHHHHRRNIIAFNDVGVAFMPSVRNNHFQDNAFVENIENVAILGAGAFEGQNSFTVDGRGNYWSDYRGFDLDDDGVGDIEYRSNGLFENLIDQEPKLRFFLYSPAQQAVDLAARSFPVVTPRPKVVDTAPWTRPPMPAPSIDAGPASTSFAPLAIALLAGGGVVALAGALALQPPAGPRSTT